jgi:hypothetical protein
MLNHSRKIESVVNVSVLLRRDRTITENSNDSKFGF